MKTFKNFLIKEDLDSLSGETHSIIDGLNRAKGATMINKKTIKAKIIDHKDLTPLSDEEIKNHEKIGNEARKKGDYYTGSMFGDDTHKYSVDHAIKASISKPTVEIPSDHPFIQHQITNWWQGNTDRAKKAAESDHPILIMKH